MAVDGPDVGPVALAGGLWVLPVPAAAAADVAETVVDDDATGGDADCEAAARPAIGFNEEKEDEVDMAPSAEWPLASFRETSLFMVVQCLCSMPV